MTALGTLIAGVEVAIGGAEGYATIGMMLAGGGMLFATDGGYWGYPCLAGSGPGVDRWRECTMSCSSERRALRLLRWLFL